MVEKSRMSRSGLLKFLLLVAVTAGLSVALAPYIAAPPCPRHVVIATGSPDGAYSAYAEKFREILARNGVTLEIRHTAGSVENANLLQDPSSGVSVAFMQGGVRSQVESEEAATIQSLASLYREPLWVFFRKGEAVESIRDLRGKRIAVGAVGSGTRAMADVILKENGIADGTAGTEYHDVSLRKAKRALVDGDIDAAFFVISPTASLIQDLVSHESLNLLSLTRSAAYARRHAFLSNVTLPEGILDFDRNLPSQEIALVAPTANLVARTDLHPTLIPLLLKAAHEVHRDGGLLEEPNEFPSPQFVDYPLNENARSYLESGPSFLYRWLPFTYAAWLDRMKLMLLPLCTLLLPLLKTAPPLYRWRIRSKIYTWYRDLRAVDQTLREGNTVDFDAVRERLHNVEEELSEVSVPLSYMMEFYHLRLHVDLVRQQLVQRESEQADGAHSSALEPTAILPVGESRRAA